MTPAVSVVMPVFNSAGTVAEAIDSICRQTVRNWELIIVDDGSQDETRDRVGDAVRRDRRLRVFTQPHQGIASALQIGLQQAKAPLIARMDADDRSHPDRLAEQMELLESSPEIGLASSLVAFSGDRENSAGYALHVDWMNTVITPEEIALNRFIESPFAHPSVMFRRELVERLGGYRAGDFPEDYELWLRWLESGVQMIKVRKVLLEWRDHPERLSRKDGRYRVEAFYRCKAVYLARWLRQSLRRERRVLIWGAGRLTRRRAEFLVREGIELGGYVDVDPAKIGRRIGGIKVYAPVELPGPEDVFVLGYVGKRGAREYARGHLGTRGFLEGRDFLMAA